MPFEDFIGDCPQVFRKQAPPFPNHVSVLNGQDPGRHDVALAEEVESPLLEVVDREGATGGVGMGPAAHRADLKIAVTGYADDDSGPDFHTGPGVDGDGYEDDIAWLVAAHDTNIVWFFKEHK